jgi:polyhydroxyalkanoate synthesis regulator phasin
MDEPDKGPYAERDPFDRLGALLGPRVDELRALLDEVTGRWRGDAVRVGEGTRQRLSDLFRDLGLVTRADWDDLELRVAQLEHRLQLVEKKGDAA